MLQIPKQFLDSVKHCDGFDETPFIASLQTTSPTSIRINPFKPAQLNFKLDDLVYWNGNGFYLNERPNFTHDALFQAGCYYVQEAGSMFIEHALKSCVNFNDELLCLDLCASPGGKSTLLNSLLNQQSVLVANEVNKQRADVLCQNLCKWGTHNTIVTNNDSTAFNEMQNVFDVILIDAPCSGSGLFRKQHDAVDEWSLDNVNLCSQRQKRITAEVVGSLKNDGILVYSTCSYSEEENECITDWLITEFNLESVNIEIKQEWGIVKTISKQHKAHGYRFYPNKTKSEGFFCTVLKKVMTNSNPNQKKIKYELFSPLKDKDVLIFEDWVSDLNLKKIIKFKDDFLLTNNLAINFINRYQHLYLKKVGTNIGSVIKSDLIPHHNLALSIHLKKEIKTISLDNETSILFMKKSLIKLDGILGWNLITHKQFGLGWIKNLGNRFNNYLPNEYRILK